VVTRGQFLQAIWQFAAAGSVDTERRKNFHGAMKPLVLLAFFAGLFFAAPQPVTAQTNAAAEKQNATLEKHLQPILAALGHLDAAKEKTVREILVAQFAALRIWHATNDAQIKPLWEEFNAARAQQNVAAANAALEKIHGVYATFQPQHENFIAGLLTVLTPAQVEMVKDVLTVKKVKVTYDVYQQIFPKLTEAQSAVVLQNLQAAREEAIDCEAMTEKSAFFKKYKIKIEDEYLTAQGYDPKQARKDFAANQKAKKTAVEEK
jgi:hypothetical protein